MMTLKNIIDIIDPYTRDRDLWRSRERLPNIAGHVIIMMNIDIVLVVLMMVSLFLCYRHQASEMTSALKAKVKSAATLLQQRKLLQRNLRSLQQHSLSREILSSEYTSRSIVVSNCYSKIIVYTYSWGNLIPIAVFSCLIAVVKSLYTPTDEVQVTPIPAAAFSCLIAAVESLYTPIAVVTLY